MKLLEWTALVSFSTLQVREFACGIIHKCTLFPTYMTLMTISYIFLPLSTALTCTHGSVRLAGGLEPTEGRVEVCVGGRWSGVCGSSWNYQDVYVLCRQLGYPATGMWASSEDHSKFHWLVVYTLVHQTTSLC